MLIILTVATKIQKIKFNNGNTVWEHKVTVSGNKVFFTCGKLIVTVTNY